MITPTPARPGRPAAISANGVFAIALAIVAGLIFAMLFKIVFFDRPAKTPAPEPSVNLTVAAVNLYDQMTIRPMDIKTVRMSQSEFDRRFAKDRSRRMLTGNQPLGRVPKVPIMAEEPMFEDQLEKFEYPESVAARLGDGMRAVNVDLNAREAMVQVNDVVDLYCSLSNDAFGPGSNGTALMARRARVVARFGSTRPGAQPADPAAPRSYTLEVTPYRMALIELAKTMGAKFSMSASPRAADGAAPAASGGGESDDPPADVVTSADLARLFRIGPPPVVIPPWEIERYAGLQHIGTVSFPNYVPGAPAPSAASPATPAGPAPRGTNGVRPAGSPTTPGQPQGRSAPATPPGSRTTPTSLAPTANRPAMAQGRAFNPRTAVVSATNFGFRPLNANGGVNCGPGG